MSSARKPGKRRRRLLLTAALLAVAAVVWITIGVILHQSKEPAAYRPGEKVEGITSKLSMGIPEEAPELVFTDVTLKAGLTFNHFSGPRSSQLPEDMGSGAAWGDYDNDGDEDLFLVSAGGALTLPKEQRAPCMLYENRGDGTFRQNTAFPETRIIGMAAAWGDYDCDGWLDLVVTGYNSLLLFRNDQGRFRIDSNLSAPGGFWAGASWGDFDNDRDPDLYVCGYVRYKEVRGERPASTRQYGREVPYTLNPSSYEPGQNLLFRNNGDGTFKEVAVELGVDNPMGRSLGALWRDFDRDGFLDLYIANDISDNALYLNTGGKFKDISHAAWVADYRGAMGLAAGDWNGDGDDDLFVTHWIAQENALYDSLFNDKAKQPTAAGEKNASPLRFMDLADMAGLGQVALRSIGWGTDFVDLDADGWLDLLVSNGSTFETEDQPPRLRPQSFFLFWNRNGKSFHNLAPLIPDLSGKSVGRGLAVCDYDLDGDLDFVRVNYAEGVQLFRNDGVKGARGEKENNWVMFRLRSRAGRSKALTGRGEGARVVATVKGRRFLRGVGAPSYLSQGGPSVHLGLGTARVVDSLEVYWLGGGKDVYTGLEANAYWELSEGKPEARRLTAVIDKTAGMDERRRVTLFWKTQRAAVRAMNVEKDRGKAIGFFKEALVLNPSHEDSLYNLGQLLDLEGRPGEALGVFKKLTAVNPSSHRAHRQIGFLLASKAGAGLAEARKSLERALEINQEETGVLLLLAEIDLIEGHLESAARRLEWVCRSNPRSTAGFYLRGYIAWMTGDSRRALELLEKADQSRAAKKAPKGGTAEGDVRVKMHTDVSLLSPHFTFPAGQSKEINQVFKTLHKYLTLK
jgi:hypothetical protein